MSLEQTGDMLSFDNQAKALVEARATPTSQKRYAVGGKVDDEGNLEAFGYSLLYYASAVNEWSEYSAAIGGDTISGTLKLTYVRVGSGIQCEQTHTFAGYRSN